MKQYKCIIKNIKDNDYLNPWHNKIFQTVIRYGDLECISTDDGILPLKSVVNHNSNVLLIDKNGIILNEETI